MTLGNDQQYGLPQVELDKIRRRLEIKHRLKVEGVRKRYDPFLQIKKVVLDDPATTRYMDLRKQGRLPGAPIKPSLYFSCLALILIPFFGVAQLTRWERKEYLELCSTGDYPLEKRQGKAKI